ncbi:MAG: right-handed parallel beta-helix repeat-containing protein [Proteobacteria bacterium]|nr:right-handed parallel beta-helix repeat-containing protein [Pseudomonadota bacterium]
MMDRLRSCLVLLGFALLPGLAGAASPGDVNTDGDVDTADALLLQRYLAEDATLTAAGEAAADLGPLVAGAYAPDGSVDAGDLVVLLRAIAGEVTLPVAPAAPVLNAVTNPVQVNPLSVGGTAPPGLPVTLYVNGQAQETVLANGSGAFNTTAILLDGFNTLFAIATDANGIDSLESNAEVADYQRVDPPAQVSLTQDTVWTPGDGTVPYVITGVNGVFTIPVDVVLTVQPGTRIEAEPGVRIDVQGVLNVQGEETNKVLFTPLTPPDQTEARGDWVGIRIDDDNAAPSRIDHATIEYAVDGIRLIRRASVTVTNTTIREFSSNGFYASSGSVIVLDNLVVTNAAGPRTGTCINLVAGIAGSSLRNSTASGCNIGVETFLGIPITGNTIETNTQGISIRQSSPALIDNDIRNNTSIGITANGNNTTPRINENRIFGNPTNFLAGNNNRPVIDATGNYWGTIVPNEVADSIVDLTDQPDTTAPIVAFTPFFDVDLDGNLIPVPGNFLSGALIGTLPAAAYQVLGDLVVVEGSTATIEAGATLTFSDAASLNASGTLVVAGTSTEPVTFTSEAKAGAGDWEGIRVEPESANTAIDFAVIEYADTAVHLLQSGQPVSVTNSDILHFSRGIRASKSSGHVFANNRFEVGDTLTLFETAMVLTEVAASITGNTFTGHPTNGLRTAIELQGTFGDGTLQTEIVGNTISNSRFGIQILSNQTVSDLLLRPLINDNVFANIFEANLQVNGTWDLGANHVIDARRNDWGVATVAEIRATIDLVGDSNETPVDFSDFRDADGQIIPGTHFTTPLIGVIHDQDVFKPGLGELVTIQFELLVPATTTLSIYPEDDDVLGTPLYEETVALAAGAHSLTWDGRTNAGEYVVPEAYQYVVTAVTPDGADIFSPSRPGGGGDLLGRIFLNRDIPSITDFNTYRNQHLVLYLDVTEARRRAGGLVRVETPAGPVSVDLYNRPLPIGTHVITWDGRIPFSDDLPPGVVPGEILEGEFPLNGGVTSKNMRVNHVVVEGTAPAILTAELPPVVAVQSTPYLIYHSYDQISEIAYRLDQDSRVTVKMLPPGVYDPADPSAITLIDDQLQPATNGLGEPETHLAVWTGFDESAGSDAGNDLPIWVDEDIDTAFTFTIEATSVLTSQQTIYRGVLQVRN